ncbi:hypothetical protein K469DRAFT_690225 [Zopfia rhizophila CBS 207.26]|uniref:Integral membrane protein n=1 Tax=Zopfia rhizophila CBS 207.26 TaxID=1314779 RepID=A0A6A6DY23_9PEZI|nr:hypothetical protein K469DRAFT_690225 [Zopfia rhizophila CBS 207.26]
MTGFLVPPWYSVPAPTKDDMYIATFVWGFSMACSIFTAVKAFRQSITSWKRMKSITAYVVMIWMEWASNVTMACLICLWVIQTLVLMQIIINRISLLLMRRSEVTKIKWTVAAILGLVNISVFCIWIPARLQISKTFIHVNEIWDRIEKGVFCLVDGSLNYYFVRLIRTKLIANGLTKYTSLFRFNLFMIALSMSLDVILIGSMSLGNGFIYVQFHPLVYMIKLHIEINNADLITKVVKATNPSERSSNNNTGYRFSTKTKSQPHQSIAGALRSHVRTMLPADDCHIEIYSDTNSEEPLALDGIQKTVSTTVVSKLCEEDDRGSEISSTRTMQN